MHWLLLIFIDRQVTIDFLRLIDHLVNSEWQWNGVPRTIWSNVASKSWNCYPHSSDCFIFFHVLGPWKAFSSTETMETAIALLRLLEILGASRDLRVKIKYEKPCKWLEDSKDLSDVIPYDFLWFYDKFAASHCKDLSQLGFKLYVACSLFLQSLGPWFMMAMWVSMCCCLHPGTHWTCVPCQIPFKDCGLPESRLACWLPTSVLHQQKLCCYEYLRILRIYLWKIRTDWLDELKLKLVVASNINPFTTSLFLMRMSLSPSTNFPTPTQYQKDFAAWDLYQAPYMDTPCHLMIYDFRQNLNSTGGTWLHPRAPRSCRCITFSLAKWRSSIEALHWQRSGTFFCGDCLFVFFLFAYGFR